MASIPIAISSGYEINMTSYIANLVLVPLLMQIIIPALLVTIFLPPLAPLTDFLLRSFEYLNGFLQPFLNINIIFGSVSLLVVILLMILLLISCYFYEKHKKLWIRLALIGLYVFVLETNRIWQPYTAITFLDVGQGDATIIRSPYQTCTVVIDTGGDVSRTRGNNPSIFSNTLEPYLLGAGVRNIDFLILTHEHYDHIAEAIPLMNRFNIRNIILNEAEHEHQMQAIVEEAKRLNIPIHIARPLDTFTCGNQVYTFIHDEIDHLDANEDSLVMTVEIDGFNVLLTADIGHVTEPAILANNHLASIDIYQVAHHGSRYSNSLAFMDALSIRYAVVQVGRRNFYGHPHSELFDVTNELGTPLLNNAVHGTIQFRLRNGNYQIHIWPFDS
jgi:competence protein ComEC